MSLDPRFQTTKDRHWLTEGTTCPVLDPDGSPMGEVHIVFDYSESPDPSYTYDVGDVNYGVLGGLLPPHEDDIVHAIKTKLGSERVRFPDGFILNQKL